MDFVTLFKSVQLLGLGGYACIAFINNVIGFRGSLGSVGRTMSMVLLKQEPAIETPLMRRAVSSATMHRLALISLMVLQLISAILLLVAAGFMLIGSPHHLAAANAGLASLLLCWSSMCLAGVWFGYWIREEGLQLAHLALIVWTLVTFQGLN